jgi:hypothetical protein
MMKKLFLLAATVTMLAALVIGGVMAWTGAAAGGANGQTGKVAFSIYDLQPTSALVVPDNQWKIVGNGGITNSGDIPVHVTGGSATVNSIVSRTAAVCLDNMLGAVTVTNSGPVGIGESYGGLYSVSVKMDGDAEDVCQSQTFSYVVDITVAS